MSEPWSKEDRWDALLEGFLHHLGDVRNLSANTVRSYRCDLEGFLAWCWRTDIDPAGLGPVDVRSYLGELRRALYAGRTVSRRLSALRTFYDWLEREGVVEGNVAAAAASPKAARALPEVLDDEQARALIAAADTSTPEGLRDRAQAELMYASGARIAEVAALAVGDVDLSQGSVRLFGKGSKERLVPLHRCACGALGSYLKEGRPQLAARSARATDAVFLSSRGNPMSADTLRLRFERLAALAGLPASVTPHAMRHTFATELLSGGADLRSVQELLGHASISTTQVYTHLSVDRLKDAALQANPRSGR
ncbi:tyrosine recombinase [Atopobiaceae bacterium 24-176]